MKTLKKIRNGLTAAGLSALMVIAPYEAEAQLAQGIMAGFILGAGIVCIWTVYYVSSCNRMDTFPASNQSASPYYDWNKDIPDNPSTTTLKKLMVDASGGCVHLKITPAKSWPNPQTGSLFSDYYGFIVLVSSDPHFMTGVHAYRFALWVAADGSAVLNWAGAVTQTITGINNLKLPMPDEGHGPNGEPRPQLYMKVVSP